MQISNQRSPDQKKNLFDIADVLAIIWRRKWLIIVPLIIVTGVTFAGSYLITPVYESSVIISIGSPMKLSVDLQRLLGDARQGYTRIDNYNRLLELQDLQNEITSSPFLSQLVQNLGLDENPDLEKAAIKLHSSRPHLTIEQIKSDVLLNSLRKKIEIGYAGRDQIRISVQSTNAFRASDMAQGLGEVFISEKMKQELGSVRLSQDFSYEQLAKYEKDLRDKTRQKTRFEKEFMKVQLDEVVASDENRKAITSEIDGAKLEIEEKKDEERSVLSRLAGKASTNLILDESANLKRLKREINSHLGTIANLMVEYTWSAPEILNHKAKLFSLIVDIEDENKNLVDHQFASHDKETRSLLTELFNVRADLEILYSRVGSLRLALDNLSQKVELIPEYQARLDQLTREVEAATDLRDKFKEQQESSQISQALLRESKYSVIEPAKVPLSPFKPERAQIVVLGFLLGLAIGGAAALLAEILDKSFRKIEDVEEAFGFPVIGVIPQIESVKRLKVRR